MTGSEKPCFGCFSRLLQMRHAVLVMLTLAVCWGSSAHGLHARGVGRAASHNGCDGGQQHEPLTCSSRSLWWSRFDHACLTIMFTRCEPQLLHTCSKARVLVSHLNTLAQYQCRLVGASRALDNAGLLLTRRCFPNRLLAGAAAACYVGCMRRELPQNEVLVVGCHYSSRQVVMWWYYL